jgi:hypothetical protein
VGKVKAKFSTSSILKKKFTKDNFEKKMWGNIVANPQCFKEKSYEAKFSTSSILKKKIDKDYFGKKKKKIHKKKEKNRAGKHCSNP